MRHKRQVFVLLLSILFLSCIVAASEEPAVNPDEIRIFEPALFSYMQTGAQEIPSSRIDAYDWFAEGGTIEINGKIQKKILVKSLKDKKFFVKRMEMGDVLFLGSFNGVNGCALVLDLAKIDSKGRLHVKAGGIPTENGYAFEDMILTGKHIGKDWVWFTSYKNYAVLGWGQFHEEK